LLVPVISEPTFDHELPESVETCHWILTVPPPGFVVATLKEGEVPDAVKTLEGAVDTEGAVGADW
jgi:hypothetical protein